MDAKRKKQDQSAKWAIRGVLFAVLGIGIIALMVDRRAHAKAQAVYDAIDAALENEETLDEAKVHEYIGAEPDDTYDGEDKIWVEEYFWKGVLKTYTVRVQ